MRRAAFVLILGAGAALAGWMAEADGGATPLADTLTDAACTTCDARQAAKTRMREAREAAQQSRDAAKDVGEPAALANSGTAD